MTRMGTATWVAISSGLPQLLLVPETPAGTKARDTLTAVAITDEGHVVDTVARVPHALWELLPDPTSFNIHPIDLVRGPRDNPEMESFFGRFKVENRSLILDADSLEELRTIVGNRIRYYNRVRRHSSLGDRPPLAIIQDCYREG